MNSQVTRDKTHERRLPEPAPAGDPPGPAWKWLLAAAIILQVAWIIALIVMSTR